jgi:hypothetical protein
LAGHGAKNQPPSDTEEEAASAGGEPCGCTDPGDRSCTIA